MLHLRQFMITMMFLWVAMSGCALDQEVAQEEGDLAATIQSTEDLDVLDTSAQELAAPGGSADSPEELEASPVDDEAEQLRPPPENGECHWCSNGNLQCCVWGPYGKVCQPASC
ncbi:MAG TPA: hypothetical protein VK698_08440 [Kofleriaceae bacterium]|nr:hypothetical protein [Kofleriaceae bacterium]